MRSPDPRMFSIVSSSPRMRAIEKGVKLDARVIGEALRPAKTDARWYQVWVERGYFRADVQAPGEPFCIVIPPKYHRLSPYGHALNTTLQDILVRWKRMDGYNTLWLPGTDHADRHPMGCRAAIGT